MPISTVTAAVVPEVRVTSSMSLSTLPFGIVTVVTPSVRLPFATVTGSTISNNAPAGATALNCPDATLSNETANGIGFTLFLPNRILVSAVNPSKIPAGNSESLLPYRFRSTKPVSPEKSPAFNSEISLFRRFRTVIDARCASVTSAAASTPSIALTIASRTAGVRSSTGVTSA